MSMTLPSSVLTQNEVECVKAVYLRRQLVSKEGVGEFLRSLAVDPVGEEVEACFAGREEGATLGLTDVIDLVGRHKENFFTQMKRVKSCEALDAFRCLGGASDGQGSVPMAQIDSALCEFPVHATTPHEFDTELSLENVYSFLYPPSEEKTIKIFKKLGAKEDHTGTLVLEVTRRLRRLIPMSDYVGKLEGHSIYIETFRRLLQESNGKLRLAERERKAAMCSDIAKRLSKVPSYAKKNPLEDTPSEASASSSLTAKFNHDEATGRDGEVAQPSLRHVKSKRRISRNIHPRSGRSETAAVKKITTRMAEEDGMRGGVNKSMLLPEIREADVRRMYPHGVYTVRGCGDARTPQITTSPHDDDNDTSTACYEEPMLLLANVKPVEEPPSITKCYSSTKSHIDVAAPREPPRQPKVAKRVIHLLEELALENLKRIEEYDALIPQVVPVLVVVTGCAAALTVPMRVALVDLQKVMRTFFARKKVKELKIALEKQLRDDIVQDSAVTLQKWGRRTVEHKAYFQVLWTAQEHHAACAKKEWAVKLIQRTARSMSCREEVSNYYAYVDRRNKKMIGARNKTRRGAAVTISNFIRSRKASSLLKRLQRSVLAARCFEERLDRNACVVQYFARSKLHAKQHYPHPPESTPPASTAKIYDLVRDKEIHC